MRNVLHAWQAFWFTPRSPTPIALYRIAFGLLVIADLVILKPEWLVWYGDDGFTRLATMRTLQLGPRLNAFLYLPHGDRWILTFFWLFLFWAFLLTIGLFTRASSIIIFLCLNSIHLRNPYILNGGDTLLRVTSFFLMFAPAGAAISIDRLWRVWQGYELPTVTSHPPWAQRLIQIQLATVYFTTFLWKMTGDGWMTGRTLYYALRLNDLQRFPIPEITSPIVLKIASLGVLIIESSFGILIWFKNFRAVILALGVCLHLTIEYSMNIPLFEWIMIAMYLTFLDPADLSQVWSHIKNRAVAHVKTGPTLLVDYKYSRCKKIADVISVLNIFGLINIEDIENGNATNLQRDCNPDRFTQSRMLTDGRLMGIVATIVSISPFIPLLWFLCPVRWVQTNLNWPATSDAAARS